MLMLTIQEYQGFKTIIGELLSKIETSETTLALSATLTQLYDTLDKRALAEPPAIGDRPAFPNIGSSGMTYRQWLIAQVLPEAMRYSKRLPNSDNPGESSAFFNEAAEIAVLQADSMLLLLETEERTKVDDDARKEKPDAEAP